VLATQALTERQGAMLFMNSWGLSSKGPKFPLSFSAVNSPIEIMPVMVQYMKKTYPGARTIALLNANDASGRESASISGPLWERAGFKVVSSDFYERGTTEFQPIASRLVAQKVDVIDLASVAPADAGLLFKELDVRGFKGVKISDTGTGVDGTVTTGGAAANGVYMAAALALDGPSATEHQRKLNEQARAAIGMGLATPHIGAYDTVYMIKAGMEKAQSIDPKKVAAALPSVSFSTFYGGQVGFGEKDIYGSVQQPILPVFITQIEDGKVVLKSRIDR
jgi:branched-chain amino acid transport system substrate-binding protein